MDPWGRKKEQTMTTRDTHDPGIPSWVDLSTPDVEGAKRFYSAVLGWEYSDAGTDEMPYSMPTPGVSCGPKRIEPPFSLTFFRASSVSSTKK